MAELDRASTYIVRVNSTGAYEDLAPVVIVPPTPGGEPVTIERGRDQGRAVGAPMAAAASSVLWNESRRFASPYTGSDLYNKLLPGRPYQIAALYGSTVLMDDPDVFMDDPVALMEGYDEVKLFTGFTEQQQESYALGGRVVSMPGLGALSRLAGVKITVGLQEATTGAAMQRVFQAVGIPSDEYVIDPDAITSGRLMPFWWAWERDALEVAREVWATEGPSAYLGEDGAGRIVFEGRNYRSSTPRSTTIQAHFRPGPIDTRDVTVVIEYVPYVNVGLEMGYDRVVNTVQIPVEVRAAQPLAQVWQHTGVLTLAADEVWEVQALDPDLSDPWTTITAPVAGTDYILTSGAVSWTVEARGPFAALITATAGPAGAVISPIAGGNVGFRLRASKVTAISNAIATQTLDASDSVAAFGIRSLSSVSIWPVLDAAEASALADAYVFAYQQPRPAYTLELVNGTSAMLFQQLARDVSDRIHIVEPWSGIDHDVLIEKISHEILGPWHRTTFTCESVVEEGWAIWDDALWDTGIWGQ